MARIRKASDSKSMTKYSGNLSTIIVLIVVVILLVIIVALIPDNQSLDQALTAETHNSAGFTPSPIPEIDSTAPTQPPVVQIEGIIVVGGVLVIIALGAVLREVLWYRGQSD